MAFTTVNGKKIHYEVYGESGDYLVMGNGLMMMAVSWLHLVPTLKQYFRVVCIDLHDMGQSEKMDAEYKSEIQCDVIKGVLDEIGAEKAHICATSYGGTVALMFALKYPEYVQKIAVFNTLAYFDPLLAHVCEIWEKAALTYDYATYYDSFAALIYAPWYLEKYHKSIWGYKEKLKPLVTPEYCKAFVRLSRSQRGYDIRDRLCEIKCPVLVVGADEDSLTPMRQQRYLAESIPNAEFVLIPGAGHGVVFENPTMLLTLIVGWFRELNGIQVFSE